MATFTLIEEVNSYTLQRIFRLSRDGKCYYDDSKIAIKNEKTYWSEMGILWPRLQYVANGEKPFYGEKKYRKIKGNYKYPAFEVKSPNLRLYFFSDTAGLILLMVSKKTNQGEDYNRIELILKEYYEFKNTLK